MISQVDFAVTFCLLKLDHSATPMWHEQVLASFQRELAKCKARSCELCWGPDNQRQDKWWEMIYRINLYVWCVYTYQVDFLTGPIFWGYYILTKSLESLYNGARVCLFLDMGCVLLFFQGVGCVICSSSILTFLDFVACLHNSVNHNFNQCAAADHLHSQFFNHWQIPDRYGQSLYTTWSNSMYILDSLQVSSLKEHEGTMFWPRIHVQKKTTTDGSKTNNTL